VPVVRECARQLGGSAVWRSSTLSGDGRSPFGSLLRQLRLDKGFSQETLAERAKISAEAVSALERGNRKAPQRQTLSLLVRALELDDANRQTLEAAAKRPSLPRRRSSTHTKQDGSPATRPRHDVFRPLTRFVGREAELDLLRDLLVGHRLVTITGAGGVGKTRTAIQISIDLADVYADGSWLVEFASIREVTLVPQAIASALDIHEIPDRPIIETIVATLRDKQLLLILDNCEHVIDEVVRATAEILTKCPNVAILATSREPLRFYGEAVFRLSTLPVPPEGIELTSELALRFASVFLFVDRASAANPRFSINEDNVQAIASINRRLDGMPLAIELAAARISALSAGEIADRLGERFRLLTDGVRNALPRQQTLRAMIDWSFDLLTHRERSLFSRLSVFAGTWSVDAMLAVCVGDIVLPQEALTLLLSLVEKSLVVADPGNDGEGRFKMLETTREYALERLAASGERTIVASRHASFVLAFTRQVSLILAISDDAAWLDMVQREIENIRAALEWCFGEGHDVAAGAEIATMIGFYWDSRSHQEGRRWLTAAREAISQFEPGLVARVFLECARVQPFSDQTFRFATAALEACRRIDDAELTIRSLQYLGQALINVGRYEEANSTLAEGLALACKTRDRVAEARLLILQGFASLYLRDEETAFARFSEAGELARLNKHDRDSALVLRGLAEVALFRGQAANAVDLSLRAMQLLERMNNARAMGFGKYHLAQALLADGRVEEARVAAVDAVRTLRGAEMTPPYAEAIIVLSAACARGRDHQRAARLLGFADARITTSPFRSGHLISSLRESTMILLSSQMEAPELRRLLALGAAHDDEDLAIDAAGRLTLFNNEESGPCRCPSEN
jgi:predicted ATPase/DNA-binding XRE family transcriptional regulator